MDRIFGALLTASTLTIIAGLVLLFVDGAAYALDIMVVGAAGVVGWTLIWMGVTWIRQALSPSRDA